MATDMDAKLRRVLLAPLVRGRRPRRAEEIARALARLEQYAEGEAVVARLRDAARPAPGPPRPGAYVENAGEIAELVQALYRSGRISTAEYTFHAAVQAESLMRVRDDADAYADQLAPIEERMDAIRGEHGLELDEDWSRAEAPPEYRRLDEAYAAVHRAAETAILRELGYGGLAALREQDGEEYDRLRERGRRATFHQEEFVPALRDLVRRYEADAERAAAAGAYLAATTLLGAAVEGLMLLRCLRSRSKAEAVAQTLPRRVRPPAGQELRKWRFETLIEVCAHAGWLPAETVEWGGFDNRGLAHAVRRLRNLVHPARHAQDRPWIEIDARAYEEAHAMYTLLRRRLEPKPRPIAPAI